MKRRENKNTVYILLLFIVIFVLFLFREPIYEFIIDKFGITTYYDNKVKNYNKKNSYLNKSKSEIINKKIEQLSKKIDDEINKKGLYKSNSVYELPIPKYEGEIYTIVNSNKPVFSIDDEDFNSYEFYGPLDKLGRVTYAEASVGVDLMPTEKRGDISMIKPSGWVQKPYDSIVGKYLYNRSHLIGYQLSAENANERNLMTGTDYFNKIGMVPFENMVAHYVKRTKNHVKYRVTPRFVGNDLVARGVHIEAKSVEDNGKGVSFHVFVFNIQPKIEIDYSTGRSHKK